MEAFHKVHKNDIPIRSVVNCKNSPNYKASKLIKFMKEKNQLKNKQYRFNLS
jgi:hypothetical protein